MGLPTPRFRKKNNIGHNDIQNESFVTDDKQEKKLSNTDEASDISSIIRDTEAENLFGDIQSIEGNEYLATDIADDSPFPEVRAAVPSTDDPSTPQNTWRMWVLGLVFCSIGSALNTLFSMHSPSFTITTLVSSLFAWPIGRLWQYIMPDVTFLGMPVNPGPFNIKEHTLITIMANVSFGGGAAYITDILVAMNNFYGVNFGWGFNIVAGIATQVIGYSFAGLVRKVLVYPSSLIWPLNLVTSTFLTNIHKNENHTANGWKISRLKFFGIIYLCSFVWYWFPGYIAQFLSYFAFPTWIRPNDPVINQVFGVSSGLGLIPITFDWNQIAGYIGSPLIPPFSAIATIFLSVVVFFWFVTPILHYTNVWHGKYLPISDSSSYDRFQNVYNVTRILNPDYSFNEKAYKEYSPLFLSTTFGLSYGLSFAAITSTIVHTVLFHGKEIYEVVWRGKHQKPDVHNRLMGAYKEVPQWWFGIVFLVSFALSIATVRGWNTEMPVWSLIVALIIAIIFLLPVGIIYALTNISVGLNVLTEFIIGYMVPGKPFAMMLFKTFGYITNNQAITFAQDMKLGHYMKIAPRTLFWAQGIACVWGAIVQVATMKWVQGSFDNICSRTQASHFTCPNGRVFFNASIIWGVIGPGRMYSPGKQYGGLLWFFLLGALLPIFSWLILLKWPKSSIKYINWPVFFTGTGFVPPATPYNYSTYCIVGFIFGFWIKRKWFSWWSKYNYSLSAGLDLGLAWSSLFIFLCLSLTTTSFPSWWGNSVTTSTMDYNGDAIQVKLPKGEFFGPSSW